MLPHPDVDLVQKECEAFDSEPFIKLGEDALAQLITRFPHNTDPAQVLLKVIALNQLYSTRINYIDLIPLSRYIAQLGIDKIIAQGLPSAVELIWSCEGMRDYYSFATKFCSWHNPTTYPIYDHYVDECLWAYKKQDLFFDFHHQDLYDYKKLVNIVATFRDHYGLSEFSFRDLDKFLWNTGKRMA